MNSFKVESLALVALALVAIWACCSEAKLLRRSRYYDDINSGFGGPYGGGLGGLGGAAMPTGERAIVTIRGARSPYDGSAPSKLAIEDNPYRGAYPRGVYDRLDGYGRRPMPMYPGQDPFSFNRPYGGSYGQSMFGAPDRIAVTGAFPYGYGRRY